MQPLPLMDMVDVPNLIWSSYFISRVFQSIWSKVEFECNPLTLLFFRKFFPWCHPCWLSAGKVTLFYTLLERWKFPHFARLVLHWQGLSWLWVVLYCKRSVACQGLWGLFACPDSGLGGGTRGISLHWFSFLSPSMFYSGYKPIIAYFDLMVKSAQMKIPLERWRRRSFPSPWTPLPSLISFLQP